MNPGEGKGTMGRVLTLGSKWVFQVWSDHSPKLGSLPPAFTLCQGEAALRDLWRNAVPSKASLMVL